MKLRYVMLLICCIHPILPYTIDDFAIGISLILEGIEKATAEKLAHEAAPFKAYNNIYATLINQKTADDIRTALLKNKDILLKLPAATQKINSNIDEIKTFDANPETFIDTPDYFADYVAVVTKNDTQEIKNFVKNVLIKTSQGYKKSQNDKKLLAEFIKDKIDKVSNINNQKLIIDKIKIQKGKNSDISHLIENNLKNLSFSESDKEKLYNKLFALSGNTIDKKTLEADFNKEVENGQTLEKKLLEKKWFDKIQKTDSIILSTEDVKQVLSALTDGTYGKLNRKKFLNLLNGSDISFKEIVTTAKNQTGNISELLYKKLDDKNEKEQKLKDILKNHDALRTFLIDNENILDTIKTSKALDYITNDDITERDKSINKLLSFNKTLVEEIVKKTPEDLTNQKYQLYYLFNPKNKDQKDLRDNLNEDNSPLGISLRKLPYKNMKGAVNIILSNASSIPYIIDDKKGRFTQKDLNIAIHQKDNLETFKNYISIIDIPKSNYNEINQFINQDTNNTQDLKTLLKNADNRNDLINLESLETSLSTGYLQKFWVNLTNDALKKAFAKNPLILANIAKYCDDDTCNQVLKTNEQLISNLANELNNSESDLVQDLELADNKKTIITLIKQFIEW